MKELGIKMVFIDPYFNHTAELFADKWMAPRLGTDVAFGLRHRLYLAHRRHLRQGSTSPTAPSGSTSGRTYVLGDSDGVPKTPEWAEAESGVPAREIRALAREWGAKKTMLAAGGLGGWGGACRSATGNEWARTMVALAAMQGYGKPGSNIWGTPQGAPSDCSLRVPRLRRGRHLGRPREVGGGLPLAVSHVPARLGAAPYRQHARLPEGSAIPRLRIPEAMMHERFEWRGKGFCGRPSRARCRSTSTRRRATRS